MEAKLKDLELDQLTLDHILPFNFIPFKDKRYILTNELGEFSFLSEQEFIQFLKNTLPQDDSKYKELLDKHFYKTPITTEQTAMMYRERYSYLEGTNFLNILVTTLRCDHSCIYCHASRRKIDDYSTDMTPEMVDKIVEVLFQNPVNNLIVEFQGGEPLANWDTFAYAVSKIREKNKVMNKNLIMTAVSNLSFLDEERLDFCLDHEVDLCTSLDGPAFLHNKNRHNSGTNSYEQLTDKIYMVQKKYEERDIKTRFNALLTITKDSLQYPKEIVDTYRDFGFRKIQLRHLNPFGFATKARKRIGYSADEFLEFFRKCVDYIIELNIQGYNMVENLSLMILYKMLRGIDVNYMDLRSPCGAGIGQMAFNYDGRVFSCDEGRMMYELKDDAFLIGDVNNNNFRELIDNQVTKSLCLASCLDCLPGCRDCVFRPYCGVCPVVNYQEQGNIYGPNINNQRCQILTGIYTYLFEKIDENNSEVMDVFYRWTDGTN